MTRPGGASARATEASALMSIGEVLAHLRTEFPDTTISKLRFLESEGLVEPQRTPAGYRKYSPADLERLHYILTAQRDQYLPLRVIREQLAARETPPRRSLVSVDSLADVDPERDGGTPSARLSPSELAERAELDDAAVRELEQAGLITMRPGGYYDAEALEIATVAAQLARFGLHARHLRPYRAAADREVGVFHQVVAPLARQRSPEASARAAETLRELSALSTRLHAALVRAGLRDTLG